MLLSLCLQCWQGLVTWNRSSDGSLKMFQAADLSLGRISASCVWRLFQRPTCVRKNCYFFMYCLRAVHSVYTWPHSTRPRTLLAIQVTRELEMEVGRLAAVRLSANKWWSREVTDSGSRTHSNPLVWFDGSCCKGAFAWSKDTVCSDIIHHRIKNPKYYISIVLDIAELKLQ